MSINSAFKRTALVSFKKPRRVFDDFNKAFKKKPEYSDKKERIKYNKRMKVVNAYDPENTGERSYDTISTTKAKAMYRILNEFHNNNRHTRKQMTKEEKFEYIQKNKEFSLYRTNLYKQTRNEIMTVLGAEAEMYKTALLLPAYLQNEVIDLEQKFDHDKKYQEENQFNEALEYSHNFLYTPQVLRIYPDDYHQILRTLINSSALVKTSSTGKEDDSNVTASAEQQENN